MWVGGKRPVAAEVREVMWQARQEGQPVSSAALTAGVSAGAGPVLPQVKNAAGCSVNDREPPWVTSLTGTRRARARLMAASADHLMVPKRTFLLEIHLS
jgi:hypothetical protein